MADLRQLLWFKYKTCTNFRLNLDFATINQITKECEAAQHSDHSLYQKIQKFKLPSIFYWGTHNLEALDTNKICIYKNLRKKIKKYGLYFYLTEPLTTYHTAQSSKNCPCEYDQYNVDFIRSKELDSIDNFCKTWGLKSVTVFSAESNLQKIFGNKYERLNLQTKSLLWPFHHLSMDCSFYPDIVKKFWCGNNRYSAHRHVIASYLIATCPKKMLNISWFCDSNVADLSKYIEIESLNQRKHHVAAGIAELDKLAPISFDMEPLSKLSINEKFNFDWAQQNPQNSYKESFCAVVTETRFFQSTSMISEKIIHAIANMKFFIIAGPPRTLEYLKTFGLKTFDKWIDESYDNELDHMKRLSKILDIIDYINSKDIDQLQIMYKEMYEVVLYNLNLLRVIDQQFLKNR